MKFEELWVIFKLIKYRPYNTDQLQRIFNEQSSREYSLQFFFSFQKNSHRSCAMSMNPKRDNNFSNGKTQEPVIQVQTSRNLKNKIYLLEEVVFLYPISFVTFDIYLASLPSQQIYEIKALTLGLHRTHNGIRDSSKIC